MAQSYYPTAQNVIDLALIDLGASDPEGGVTPTTTQRTNALAVFNMLVTSWQAHGMQVWCQKQGTHTLTASTSSYTVGPSGNINIARPLSIQQAWLRDVDSDPDRDVELTPISREEYNRISMKAQTGTPTVFFYDPEYDLPGSNSGASAKGKLYLWPAPDADAVSKYDLYFIYTRPIQDFSVVGDSLDFPQEWFNAVRWNLAQELCPSYTVPITKWDRIKANARETLILALSWDKENTSVTISPETR